MSNLFERITKVTIIILLIFSAFCLFEISQNGRYQLSMSDGVRIIIDTRTGKTFLPINNNSPRVFSKEIK